MSKAVDPEVAALVREVLAEEVARLRAEKGARAVGTGTVREERVRIRSDADLRDFATRVLAMAENAQARRALATGRIVFRLDGAAPESASRRASTGSAPRIAEPGSTEVVEDGLFSERQAERLPPETMRVRLGRNVKMTPLARDRLRRRGIVIERM